MEIKIERGKIFKLESLPPYSIALDGAVSGPEIDDENHKFSFDHHAGCIRFCTTSACMQAMDAVLLGLDPAPYTIYCNDVDSDVCAAIWCLKNPTRCKEPLVEKLITAIGKSDMFAGAIEMNGLKRAVEWVAEPQISSIRNGDYEKLSNEGLKTILESVLHRIDLYANGEASIEVSKQQTHDNFKVIRKENGWALIEAADPHILSTIWHSGFDKVAIVRPLEDGSTAVTLARKSDFIDGFPLKRIYDVLNEYEDTSMDKWGGSSCIGGAPRNPDGSRSKLSIELISQIIDSVVAPDKFQPPSKPRKTNSKKPGPKQKPQNKHDNSGG